ncbi:calmodulin-binding-domain-containing protein [Ochromonadaceae sp. CCMP2298]|nr:calmodulin-binding-domain-containing protein [Ochromonadaceae sp. CCMP2298]|mmetsp:Transcript_23122/g.51361  ORF Transcript_23122/g.51361 Transcript_23122/m.51361 type:complete len:249 (+) Transcript_23122:143-889(+)|eukprot:CAMPEP_0173209506 /NCGR_PEP_ID=MMETSP1141-20130122/23131_1 /TAXON_ID=483371 /ORGANISM="non described non described, Strain CCMP2298" /LENGTH=248 /DNA_ID=CAMNT_0014136119 /DNA_START=127 /DNA_END=873 /DNA_ORIENTATION=-
MNESIYNLVPYERQEAVKQPMYRSQNLNKDHVAGSTFGCHGTTRLYGAGQMVKKDGALFGPPKDDYNLPKTHKLATIPKAGSFSYGSRRKDTIPNKDERPIMGITTTKNFVTANAVEAILQAPKPMSNLELNYMMKEDFGKVPEYLTQVKEEIRRENVMIDRYIKEQMGEVEMAPEVYEELPEDERADLVTDLKAKWDSVNAQYQKITHLVTLDTTGQVRRKETLEGALATLEADIQKLDRARSVLIR